MRIRLLVGWNGNEAGAELDLDRGQASLLVDRGKAERIPEPANKSRPKKKR